MITALTTFHKAGLDLYGQRFIDSFAKNVDKKIKLLVYAENCTPVNPDTNQITIIDSKELVKLNQFKSRWGNVPKANGECPFPEKRPRDHHKNLSGTQYVLLTKCMQCLTLLKEITTSGQCGLMETHMCIPLSITNNFNNYFQAISG